MAEGEWRCDLGTRPWKIFGEGPTQVAEGSFNDTNTRPYTPDDFRFTTKGDVLYAIELGWPTKPEAVIHSIGTGAVGERTIESVELLGSDGRFLSRPGPTACIFSFRIAIPASMPTRFEFDLRGVNSISEDILPESTTVACRFRSSLLVTLRLHYLGVTSQAACSPRSRAPKNE